MTFRFSKFAALAVFAVAVLLAVPVRSKADSVTTYDFTGTLTNGTGTITGTFTYDSTLNTVSSFDFNTPGGVVDSANSGQLAFVFNDALHGNAPSVFFRFENNDSANNLELVFNTTDWLLTLDEAAPGKNTMGVISLFDASCSTFASFFTSGSATPSNGPIGTPEPPAGLLLFAGLLLAAPLAIRAARS